MAKFFSIIVLSLALAVPSLAAAQTRLAPLPVQEQQFDVTNGVDPGQVLAIGAGVIVGTLVGGYVLNFQGASLLGGLAGGLVANWWYGDGDDILALEPRE